MLRIVEVTECRPLLDAFQLLPSGLTYNSAKRTQISEAECSIPGRKNTKVEGGSRFIHCSLAEPGRGCSLARMGGKAATPRSGSTTVASRRRPPTGPSFHLLLRFAFTLIPCPLQQSPRLIWTGPVPVILALPFLPRSADVCSSPCPPRRRRSSPKILHLRRSKISLHQNRSRRALSSSIRFSTIIGKIL